MNANRFLLLTLVILIFLLAGCSKTITDSADTPGALNLESEFGGYSATTEAPGFGSADLMSELETDKSYDDPILSNSEMTVITSDHERSVYRIRILWGQLRYDSTVSVNTDWTGNLSVSRGGIVIRRLIRFEQNDKILERLNRHQVDWVSLTNVHNDGIVVDIIVPPLRPIFDTVIINDSIVIDTTFPETDDVTVSFNTGPYSRVFDLSELPSLDTIVFLEDSNAVAFHAFKADLNSCPRGLVAGRWGVMENGRNVFLGKWMNESGTTVGYLKGHFGQKQNGDNVFFGKWISANGRFEGFVRGFFQPLSDSNFAVGGYFLGGIFKSDGVRIGVTRGKFIKRADDKTGFFQGHWGIGCHQNSSVDMSEGIDL